MGENLTVIVGCMFAGKSSELINLIRAAKQHQHTKVLTFKHSIDNRYSITDIVSHNGLKEPATAVKHVEDIDDAVSEEIAGSADNIGLDVFIDEGQFFEPSIVGAVKRWCGRCIRVTVAGLDLDSESRPFGSMLKLCNKAARVITLRAKCDCGALASKTARLNESKEVIQTGGAELYQPKCNECYSVLKMLPKQEYQKKPTTAKDVRGASSRSIFKWMTRPFGALNMRSLEYNYPHDIHDFERNRALLLCYPEWKQRLSEMSAINAKWKTLVDHWEQIENLYDEDHRTFGNDAYEIGKCDSFIKALLA